jgi:hypothetical protein
MTARPPGVLRRLWRLAAPALAAGLLGAVCWLAWTALPPGETLAAVRNWPALWAAAALYMAVLALLPVLWAGLLRSGLDRTSREMSDETPRAAHRVGLPELYATYSRSWLARYIPGRVWTYGGRALLAARLGVPMAPIARSMVLEILFSYGMLTVLGAGLLLWAERGAAAGLAAIAAGTAATALAIGFLGRAGGLSRMLPARLRALGSGDAARAAPLAWPIAAYAGHGALNLAFFVCTALAFVPLAPLEVVHVAGAWGLAMTLGWLAFIAPGGLGARDGVALVFLATLVDTPTAALIVAAARLLGVALDFLFVGLVEAALLLRRLRRARAAPTPSPSPTPPARSLTTARPETLP